MSGAWMQLANPDGDLAQGVGSIKKNPGKLIPRVLYEGYSFGARTTGLEPATSGSTGRCSNQLSYVPKISHR